MYITFKHVYFGKTRALKTHRQTIYPHKRHFHQLSFFFISGVPQHLDAGDLGRPTRYCYLESIYHTWDGGTDHRASLVSHPTQCVAVLGGLH